MGHYLLTDLLKGMMPEAKLLILSNAWALTDAERVLASSIDGLTDLNIGELRYCTKVKYLDIGHSVISDLSFIRPMRDLEVLILSLTRVRDLSPITGLDKLEFFEFGQSYQLTVTDQSGYSSLLSRLSVRKLVNGMIYFFIRTEDLVGDFPHIVEGGIFFSYPVFIAGLFALTGKKVRAALRENKLVLFTLGAVFAILMIVLMDGVWSPYMLSRYIEDLTWLVGMLVFLMVGLRYADGGENAEFSSAVCLLAIYSIFVCAFVFVQLDMKFFLPEQIALIKKIIGVLTFGL